MRLPALLTAAILAAGAAVSVAVAPPAALAATASPCTDGVPLTNATTQVQQTYETCSVDPGATNPAITKATTSAGYHYSVEPPSGSRNGRLLVFLGGSFSTPTAYNLITNEAATLGFGAIDLKYPDDKLIGTACTLSLTQDACYTAFRGTTVYGNTITYPGLTRYTSAKVSVNAANSVVGRLVSELSWLGTRDAWWTRFLVPDPAGYPTPTGTFLPDWADIVLAGHSQGGGDAAFAGMTLPTPVHRVVMFSSPQDAVGSKNTPAGWITAAPRATPMTSFWGLRSEGEGSYGSNTGANWAVMGRTGAGGTAGTGFPIGTGATYTAPTGHETLDLSSTQRTALGNHCSTACDGIATSTYPAARAQYWDYLFSAGG